MLAEFKVSLKSHNIKKRAVTVILSELDNSMGQFAVFGVFESDGF